MVFGRVPEPLGYFCRAAAVGFLFPHNEFFAEFRDVNGTCSFSARKLFFPNFLPPEVGFQVPSRREVFGPRWILFGFSLYFTSFAPQCSFLPFDSACLRLSFRFDQHWAVLRFSWSFLPTCLFASGARLTVYGPFDLVCWPQRCDLSLLSFYSRFPFLQNPTHLGGSFFFCSFFDFLRGLLWVSGE